MVVNTLTKTMLEATQENDSLTVAAIGLLAMCVVTFDHEALGHGGACLALHGRILVLSSSVFRCDLNSGLIDAAGPFTNVLVGFGALALRLVVSPRALRLRLFLALVTTFSFFWESGYLLQAALTRHGDLYFFARWAFGAIADWARWAAAAAGVILYILSARLAARTLLEIASDPNHVKIWARSAWLSATVGAALAALAYSGGMNRGFRDAVLEIGLASIPLLFIATHERGMNNDRIATINRSVPLIGLALTVYAVFVMTLGRGLIR